MLKQQQSFPVFDGIESHGEITSNGTATVFPSVAGGLVRIKAQSDNSDSVFIGTSTVTTMNGTTDTTTGYELAPGDAEWFFVTPLSSLYLISITSGDGVTYLVYRP